MTFSTWSQTAASNTAVGGISTDGNVTLVNQIDNMFRGMMAELAVARDDGTIDATAERGYLHGLTLSNNAGDATNDIDIAVGECATSDSPYWKMALASALTKRLDAAWAVGTNQGGLDTGAIANTTYHIWLIQRSDTLVVDALFSTSATAPTMPANYDRKRRIGSIIRLAGTIVAFTQRDDVFYRTSAVDRASASAASDALVTLSVPTGIRVQPIFSSVCTGTTLNLTNFAGPGDASQALLSLNALVASGTANANSTVILGGIYTNTSAQIRFTATITSGTITTNNITTHGWIDTRGRLG